MLSAASLESQIESLKANSRERDHTALRKQRDDLNADILASAIKKKAAIALQKKLEEEEASVAKEKKKEDASRAIGLSKTAALAVGAAVHLGQVPESKVRALRACVSPVSCNPRQCRGTFSRDDH